jgi:acetyl-CoA C-acetyltransferase
MGSDGGAWALDPVTNYDSYFVPQGIGADLIATLEGFSRTDVDTYAVRSQQLAKQAWDEGRFARSIVPVTDMNGLVVLDHDEHMRPESTVESLGALNPSFAGMGEAGGFDAVALQKYHQVERIDHVHTPANSSGIVDGAALMLVGSGEVGHDLGLTPRARIVATATSGADPTIMLTGPTPATRKLLRTAGLTPADIDLWEINEAFASVPLAACRVLDIDEDKVNIFGSGCSLGHPVAASGARMITTLTHELRRRGGGIGVAAMCAGGGQGGAVVIEVPAL